MATSNNKNVIGWILININNHFMCPEKMLLFLLISCKFLDILSYITAHQILPSIFLYEGCQILAYQVDTIHIFFSIANIHTQVDILKQMYFNLIL